MISVVSGLQLLCIVFLNCRTHLSFCFNFFLHGESSVCASIEVKQHPPVWRLTTQHLTLTQENHTNFQGIYMKCNDHVFHAIIQLFKENLTFNDKCTNIIDVNMNFLSINFVFFLAGNI